MIKPSSIKDLLVAMADPNDTQKDLTHALGLSALVYFSDDFIIKQLTKLNLPYRILSHKDMKCLIAENDTSVIIAFRGTDTSLWANWKRILNVFPRKFMYDLRVHGGFQDYWAEYARFVDVFIKSIDRKKKIIFTGHSLGAAVASLYNISYTKSSQCIAFASPKYLYNSKFLTSSCDSYRILRDFVTWIPFSIPYFVWNRACSTKRITSYKGFWNPISYHSLETYIKTLLKHLSN